MPAVMQGLDRKAFMMGLRSEYQLEGTLSYYHTKFKLNICKIHFVFVTIS